MKYFLNVKLCQGVHRGRPGDDLGMFVLFFGENLTSNDRKMVLKNRSAQKAKTKKKMTRLRENRNIPLPYVVNLAKGNKSFF